MIVSVILFFPYFNFLFCVCVFVCGRAPKMMVSAYLFFLIIFFSCVRVYGRSPTMMVCVIFFLSYFFLVCVCVWKITDDDGVKVYVHPEVFSHLPVLV
jgi:hypothetical protein